MSDLPHGPGGRFGHREHLALAWSAVRAYGREGAREHVSERLRELTAYARAPQKYHETVSRAWVDIVAHHAAAASDDDFAGLLARYPRLLDKRLLSRHYRSATLAGADARQSWVAPDLVPFPWS